jgi:YD repeat-containing protein
MTRYSHDANGNLVSTLHPSGILDERSYDAAGRLTKIKGKDSHERFFYVRSYTYDPVGNPLTLEAAGVPASTRTAGGARSGYTRDTTRSLDG